MAPRITSTSQMILIPADRSSLSKEGCLIFADDQLMAVVVDLKHSMDSELRGLWYLETGYGPCLEEAPSKRTFKSLDEAQQWVLERVTRARENEGPPLA